MEYKKRRLIFIISAVASLIIAILAYFVVPLALSSINPEKMEVVDTLHIRYMRADIHVENNIINVNERIELQFNESGNEFIKSFVLNDGYKIRDISVITNDFDSYKTVKNKNCLNVIFSHSELFQASRNVEITINYNIIAQVKNDNVLRLPLINSVSRYKTNTAILNINSEITSYEAFTGKGEDLLKSDLFYTEVDEEGGYTLISRRAIEPFYAAELNLIYEDRIIDGYFEGSFIITLLYIISAFVVLIIAAAINNKRPIFIERTFYPPKKSDGEVMNAYEARYYKNATIGKSELYLKRIEEICIPNKKHNNKDEESNDEVNKRIKIPLNAKNVVVFSAVIFVLSALFFLMFLLFGNRISSSYFIYGSIFIVLAFLPMVFISSVFIHFRALSYKYATEISFVFSLFAIISSVLVLVLIPVNLIGFFEYCIIVISMATSSFIAALAFSKPAEFIECERNVDAFYRGLTSMDRDKLTEILKDNPNYIAEILPYIYALDLDNSLITSFKYLSDTVLAHSDKVNEKDINELFKRCVAAAKQGRE